MSRFSISSFVSEDADSGVRKYLTTSPQKIYGEVVEQFLTPLYVSMYPLMQLEDEISTGQILNIPKLQISRDCKNPTLIKKTKTLHKCLENRHISKMSICWSLKQSLNSIMALFFTFQAKSIRKKHLYPETKKK